MNTNIEIFRLNFISTITGFLEYFSSCQVMHVKVEEIVKEFYPLINTLLTQHINKR